MGDGCEFVGVCGRLSYSFASSVCLWRQSCHLGLLKGESKDNDKTMQLCVRSRSSEPREPYHFNEVLNLALQELIFSLN